MAPAAPPSLLDRLTGAEERRRHTIETQLLHAAVQLSEAVAAGRSFADAVSVAAAHGRPPLSTELAKLVDDLHGGAALEVSLRELRDRLQHEDVAFLVAAVILQRQAGGSLSELLDNIALVLRERLRLRDLTRSLTAQGRLSGVLLGGLPVLLFFYMLWMVPNHVSKLWTWGSFPFNMLPLAACVVSEALGYLWIRKLVTIDFFGPVEEPLLGSFVPGAAEAARRERIARQAPQVLDLLVVAIEAGHGFDSALQQVTRVYSGPLITELERVLERMLQGAQQATAMHELADRCPVAEVQDLVSTVLSSRQLGTPLGKALRTQASQIRRKRAQQAEEEARKAGVKILFPLATCIFPVLLVLLLGPVVFGLAGAFRAIK